jgi:hypothetical protein
MNCGICVVLPQPVAPEIITICKIQKVRLYCKSWSINSWIILTSKARNQSTPA